MGRGNAVPGITAIYISAYLMHGNAPAILRHKIIFILLIKAMTHRLSQIFHFWYVHYSSLHVTLPQPFFDHVFKLNIGLKFLNNHSIDCLENW
jgi:hypothetical protein